MNGDQAIFEFEKPGNFSHGDSGYSGQVKFCKNVAQILQ